MSLADYLAKNYLNADPPRDLSKKKKKKRKQKDDGLVIADDDVSGWDSQMVGEDEDGQVAVVDTQSAEFRKAKKSGWTKISGPTGDGQEDEKEADAIIAATAAENARLEKGEGPTLDDDGLRMTSGARAGLQTAAQVTADIDAIRAAELARFRKQGGEATGANAETIYRDASGRIINVAMKRAELRAKAEAEEAKAKAEAEAAKGDAFRQRKEERARELEEAKFMPLARGVDDIQMNEELKAQDRWNDPAAQFLSSVKQKKTKGYQGAWAPNRYNIPPGERWDGVDRGTGFEKEWFLARNRKQRNKDLDYQWQIDE